MASSDERHERIRSLLRDFEGARPLRTLFWEALGYDRVDKPISVRGAPQAVDEALAGPPTLLAEAGRDGGFRVIYARLRRHRLSPQARERAITRWLLRRHPHTLFVFSNHDRAQWHVVNVPAPSEDEVPDRPQRRTLRRLSIRPSACVRTATERLAEIALERIGERCGKPPRELAPSEIQSCHDAAFSVEAVTRAFYDDYLAVFEGLKADLRAQSGDQRWAHRYALLFLSRCLFVYFIQKNGWLGGDARFLDTFWQAYQDGAQPQEGEDGSFSRWLRVLFFEGFAEAGLSDEHAPFPPPVRQALAGAPSLDGRLFRPGDLDDDRRTYGATISDEQYRRVSAFLGRYHFTTREDRPLDREVAVDPEMIGKVYESLVNVSAETDERGEAGIFYTPRTEIDLMCRLSLADYLTNHLADRHAGAAEAVVFALVPREKRQADDRAAEAGLWQDLRALLRAVTSVDPACGSGAFLVGMLQVLDDLLRRADERLGPAGASAYERRKRIIGRSLYGVDAMDWATRVTELRLWLALVACAGPPPSPESPAGPAAPLLPSFALQIRHGDALVQEVGGTRFALGAPRPEHELRRETRDQVQAFAAEKRSRLRNAPAETCAAPGELQETERALLERMLRDHLSGLRSQIERLERCLAEPQAQQMRLLGDAPVPSGSQTDARVAKWEEEKAALASQAADTQDALDALAAGEPVPLVWGLAFIEVFSGDDPGFDVVMGNPPYVRQEHIADPTRAPSEATREDRKAYKQKLAQAVHRAFPNYFGFDTDTEAPETEIDQKSDLYIYFYYCGLRLLNERGTLCFITSNTWLDVAYGKGLQEFLLRHAHIKYIIDNQGERSFTDADVNTVVTLFSAPADAESWALREKARFVMLKTPFRAAISHHFWASVQAVDDRDSSALRRVFAAPQAQLLANGSSAAPDVENGSPQAPGLLPALPADGEYEGDKWGGKYLKAPDVYWKIMDHASEKLCRLGDVAEVRRGYTTGANAFFYLEREDVDRWGIEDRFLAPLLKSPRETDKQLVLEECDFNYQVFDCGRAKEALRGTQALEYIEWGEEQGFPERRTLAGRARWWSLRSHEAPPIISPCSVNDLYRAHVNECGVRVDKRLYEVRPNDGQPTGTLALSLNATLTSLFLELLTRTGLGEGLLDMAVYELRDCPVVHPEHLGGATLRDRKIKEYPAEISAQERIETDEVVLGALGLSAAEQREVRDAVEALIDRRGAKAQSV
jgi:hypothetical protein